MKRKIFIYMLYVIALALLPVLLILITRFKSPTELMSPPSLDGEQGLIQAAFEASVDSDNVILQHPIEGNYKTAFVLYDLDGDDQEEALVFYTLKTDENTVRANIVDYIDGKWVSVYDEDGYGTDVLSVDFVDLNNDGHIEILTCWNLYEKTTSKVLSVHSVTNNANGNPKVEILVNQSYTFKSVFDVDSDDDEEIFVVWNDAVDKLTSKTYASLLKQSDDGSILQVGENVSLDSSISSYKYSHLERSDGDTIIYLDALKGEDSMITEVILWDASEGTLKAPLLDPETLTNTSTLRTSTILSYDINDDGKIEIPIEQKSNGEDYEGETVVNIFAWSTYSGDELVSVEKGVISPSFKYFFKLSDSIIDNVLVYGLSNERTYTFYWTDDGEERGDALFSLVATNEEPLEYDFLVENDGTYIYGKLTSAGEEAGFTSEMIENSITFIDD